MADGDGRVNGGRGSSGCLDCLLPGLLMMTPSLTGLLLLSFLVPARRLYSKEKENVYKDIYHLFRFSFCAVRLFFLMIVSFLGC